MRKRRPWQDRRWGAIPTSLDSSFVAVLFLLLLLAPGTPTALAPVMNLGPGFVVGNRQLAFRFFNGSAANWGCLDGVYVGGDKSPTARGVLTGGSLSTPPWQITATACNASFPEAQLVLEGCTAVCASKHVVSLASTAAPLSAGSAQAPTTVAHLRWEECATPFIQRTNGEPATLDVDVILSVTGGVSTWGITVGKSRASGVCLQSVAVPDLRTLRAGGTETLIYP